MEANNVWNSNEIQFPRLIAEISANVDMSADWDALCNSMDISSNELNELFDRADKEWEEKKKRLGASI